MSANQSNVRSRSTGLVVLLGGLGAAAAGAYLFRSSFEEKTIPGSCLSMPAYNPGGVVIRYETYCSPGSTYTEYNRLKAAAGMGLIGAATFLVVKGISLMR